ncbi:MAG: Clp protease N-terminal domain-containing protein, partial [Planctomycetota bacterium]
MANVDLKSLVARLSPLTRGALESATGLCLSRTNYNVEIEHWLTKILEADGSDLAHVLTAVEADSNAVAEDLARAIDALKTGNGRTPALAPDVV